MIVLKSLSNDVDLSNQETSYFLVFENTATKKTFRLPVSEQTAEVVVQEVLASVPTAPTVKVAAEEIEDNEDEYATTFGDDEELPTEDTYAFPASEDEVPSL